MNTAIALFKDSWHEINNEVTWPKFAELQNSTWLVLVASIIFALLVGILDFLFKAGLDLFYTSF